VISSAYDNDFKKIDGNNDGKISKKEFLDAAIKNFNIIDKNKDGFLTIDELKAIGKIDAIKFMKEVDINKDGKISKEEFIKAAEKKFKLLDKNNDSFIDQKEWNDIKDNVNKNNSKISPVAPFIIFRF
jgi:Ca2+-binding EF-hand superfamily protein